LVLHCDDFFYILSIENLHLSIETAFKIKSGLVTDWQAENKVNRTAAKTLASLSWFVEVLNRYIDGERKRD